MTETRRELRRFMLLAFGLTWGLGGVALILGYLFPALAFTSSNPLYYLAAYSPSIAALIITNRDQGPRGVRTLLKGFVPTRRAGPWYLVAILAMPIAYAAVAVLTDGWRLAVPVSAVPVALAANFFRDAGPLGEELGWRGFALPRILLFRSQLAAAVILGLIWAAWHIPTFFIPTLTQSHLSIPLFFVETVALSIILTWLWDKSGGNVLLMVLVHLVSNVIPGVLGISFAAQTAAQCLLAVTVIAEQRIRGK